MAKTQLLADIATQSGVVSKRMDDLAAKLNTVNEVTQEHWADFTKIGTEMEKLGQLVGKMKVRIASWDGSTKLKNLLKDQKKLAAARDDAKKRFSLLEADYQSLHLDHKAWIQAMSELDGRHH